MVNTFEHHQILITLRLQSRKTNPLAPINRVKGDVVDSGVYVDIKLCKRSNIVWKSVNAFTRDDV